MRGAGGRCRRGPRAGGGDLRGGRGAFHPRAAGRVGQWARRCAGPGAVAAAQRARRGVSSVVDFGLTTRAQRDGWLHRAANAKIKAELHALQMPREVRWSRVQARNDAGKGTFVFPVTHAMFEDMERLWEAPDATEAAQYLRLHRISE